MKYMFVSAAVVLFLGTAAASYAQQDDSILADEYIVSQESVEATVVRVRPLSRTITVRGAKRGKTRQFTVPEDARIMVNGRAARLRDIRVGDEVLITMRPRQQEVVVTQLRVPEPATTLEQRRAEPPPVESSAPQPVATVLPATASAMPVVLLIGMAFCALALFFRINRAGAQ